MADHLSRSLLRRVGRRVVRRQETRAELSRRYAHWKLWPPVGFVRFGNLRRDVPFSRSFGFDRGTPVDRYYIDQFLRRNSGAVIRGSVLEIGEPTYTSAFGRPDDIERLDILHISADYPGATVVADLADGKELPSDCYDCVICTQTLLLIYDVHAAVRTLHRILKPDGTALVTLPGISQICRAEADRWGDYWRFTSMSARRLFSEAFDPPDVSVESYGNVLTATAFLYGLAAQDLRPRELENHDPDYQVTIGVKAVKRSRRS